MKSFFCLILFYKLVFLVVLFQVRNYHLVFLEIYVLTALWQAVNLVVDKLELCQMLLINVGNLLIKFLSAKLVLILTILLNFLFVIFIVIFIITLGIFLVAT